MKIQKQRNVKSKDVNGDVKKIKSVIKSLEEVRYSENRKKAIEILRTKIGKKQKTIKKQEKIDFILKDSKFQPKIESSWAAAFLDFWEHCPEKSFYIIFFGNDFTDPKTFYMCSLSDMTAHLIIVIYLKLVMDNSITRIYHTLCIEPIISYFCGGTIKNKHKRNVHIIMKLYMWYICLSGRLEMLSRVIIVFVSSIATLKYCHFAGNSMISRNHISLITFQRLILVLTMSIRIGYYELIIVMTYVYLRLFLMHAEWKSSKTRIFLLIRRHFSFEMLFLGLLLLNQLWAIFYGLFKNI